jgi:hypothetical protein
VRRLLGFNVAKSGHVSTVAPVVRTALQPMDARHPHDKRTSQKEMFLSY